MKFFRIAAPFVWIALSFASSGPQSQDIPYHQSDFQPEEFKSRWATIFDKIGNQAVAVFQGVSQTNGFIYPRQTTISITFPALKLRSLTYYSTGV